MISSIPYAPMDMGYCERFAGFSGGIVKDDLRIVRFFGGRYEYILSASAVYSQRAILIRLSFGLLFTKKRGQEI